MTGVTGNVILKKLRYYTKQENNLGNENPKLYHRIMLVKILKNWLHIDYKSYP